MSGRPGSRYLCLRGNAAVAAFAAARTARDFRAPVACGNQLTSARSRVAMPPLSRPAASTPAAEDPGARFTL